MGATPSRGGNERALDLASRQEEARVFNLTVRGNHNYAVSQAGVLVHNKVQGGSRPVVTLYRRLELEHFEVSIVGASRGVALLEWLRENEYPVPERSEPVLDAYVEDGWDFVVAKLQPVDQR